MYPIHPEKVYVMERVYDNPQATTRLKKMLEVMKPKEIIKLTDSGLQNLIREKNWTHGYAHRTGFYRRKGTPSIIFNTFRWGGVSLAWSKIRYPYLNRAMFLGDNPLTFREKINHLERNICQAAWEMHSIFGCLHACDYCHVEDFVNIMLNIEDLIEYLKKFIPQHPELQLYKYDNHSDINSFEPEYNATEPLVRYFATLQNQYILLYTKSANVDYLLNLPHNGHTLISWSLAPHTQSTLIEKGAPSMEQRILAMEKCQKAGYHVRVRFSPLIPVPNWKEEISAMVTQLFSKVRPDVISIDVIGFMTPKVLREVIDNNLIDTEAHKILDEVDKSKHLYGKHVFPHEYRLQMFQHVFQCVRAIDNTVPITLCNETKEMWEDLKEFLTPNTIENYVCCCGPNSVPGNPLLKII